MVENKNPCIGCDFEKEDKNRPECFGCQKRIDYVRGIGSSVGSSPNVKKEDMRACVTCRKTKPIEDFDDLQRGEGKKKTCRECDEKYFKKRSKRASSKKDFLYIHLKEKNEARIINENEVDDYLSGKSLNIDYAGDVVLKVGVLERFIIKRRFYLEKS